MRCQCNKIRLRPASWKDNRASARALERLALHARLTFLSRGPNPRYAWRMFNTLWAKGHKLSSLFRLFEFCDGSATAAMQLQQRINNSVLSERLPVRFADQDCHRSPFRSGHRRTAPMRFGSRAEVIGTCGVRQFFPNKQTCCARTVSPTRTTSSRLYVNRAAPSASLGLGWGATMSPQNLRKLSACASASQPTRRSHLEDPCIGRPSYRPALRSGH